VNGVDGVCAGNSEDETNFFRTLRDEIRKIATFFLKEQAKHATQIAAIEESFASLKVSLLLALLLAT
jgi:hypothetical protein